MSSNPSIPAGSSQFHPSLATQPSIAADASTRPAAELPRASADTTGLPTRTSRSSSPPRNRVSLPDTARAAPTASAALPTSAAAVPTAATVPATTSATTSAATATTISQLRQSEHFLDGIKTDPSKTNAFQQLAIGPQGPALQFIATNVNPNGGLYGMGLNALKAAAGGHMALKQNCVFCSTATDQNLEALASGHPPEAFWVADKTSAGNLPPVETAQLGLKPEDQVSTKLLQTVGPGRRGIISVPQRNTDNYNHAMNVVRSDDGAMRVIDGQNGKVYDLSTQQGQQAFDTKFGHNGGPSVARFFETGAAPRAGAAV